MLFREMLSLFFFENVRNTQIHCVGILQSSITIRHVVYLYNVCSMLKG
jgi:hypothetical protein